MDNAALFYYYCDLDINANLPLNNDTVKLYWTTRSDCNKYIVLRAIHTKRKGEKDQWNK